MNVKLCDIDETAREKLPPEFTDRSRIGVHYVNAFIKPMNVTLDDGTRVRCKRKGLKILLSVGDRKGEGLMRRLDVGPDPVEMLDAALEEAAAQAGVTLTLKDGAVFLETEA